jgi:hypothetical protein
MMTKSATDVMQEIIYAAVVDSLDALKAASKGVPNTMLRELNAIHANATFADLPKELQAAITASVRGAFNRLLKEGYSVAPRDAAPARPPVDRRVPEGARPSAPRGPRGPSRGPRGDGKPRPRRPA